MPKLNKKGQTLTEYLIVTALIGVGAVAVMQVLSKNLNIGLGKISEAIRGKKYDNQGESLKEKHYSIKDLGNFNSEFVDSNTSKK